MTTAPEVAATGITPVVAAPPQLQVFPSEMTAAITAPTARAKRRARRTSREVASTVWADLRTAWFWDAAPPTIPAVWRARIVSYDQVPVEEHRCLTLSTEHLGLKLDSSGPVGSCRCPGASAVERSQQTTRNRTRIALRWGWIAWNFAVAIPASIVLYVLAWVLQHPARSFLAFSLVAVLYGVAEAGIHAGMEAAR